MGFKPLFLVLLAATLAASGAEAFYRPAMDLTELSANKDFLENLKWFFNLSDEPVEVLQEQKNPECLTRPFSPKWMALQCWKEQGTENLPENRRYSYTLFG